MAADKRSDFLLSPVVDFLTRDASQLIPDYAVQLSLILATLLFVQATACERENVGICLVASSE